LLHNPIVSLFNYLNPFKPVSFIDIDEADISFAEDKLATINPVKIAHKSVCLSP
jgi:hypothetical protein